MPTVVLIGLVLFAAATAATAVLITDNRGDSLVRVRAVGHGWLWPEHRIVTAGLALGFLGLVGVALLRHGMARRRRLRREHAELVAENDRLRELLDLDALPFFIDETTHDGPTYSEFGGRVVAAVRSACTSASAERIAVSWLSSRLPLAWAAAASASRALRALVAAA